MRRNTKASQEFTLVIRSVGRFLAYCAMVGGCRPYLRRNGTLALLLILPDGAEMDDYRHAAHYAFRELDWPELVDFGESVRIVIAADRWQRGPKDSVRDDVLTHDRLVILAHDTAEVPGGVVAAVDGVVILKRPSVGHLVGAGRVCLRQRVTEQQAKELASMPLVLLGLMLWRGRPVSQSLEHMRQALKDREPVKDRQLRIEHLHGLGEAGAWARELAIDLQDWREGRIGWVDVDKGILISGLPGTGKTTFVKALAATCDVHLVLGSLARWQARGHLGDLLKAMRAAFDEARKNAPAIVFIDEIDAVGDRQKFNDHNADYSTQVVAGLLECIDGAEKAEGIVVVGACNYPEKLDAALVRPGRLDRHVQIPLPDGLAREGIVRWHLAGALQDRDLSSIVARTEGWSGAALEQLVRDARRSARRARRAIVIADLEAALPPMVAVPDSMLRRAAVHEVGHLVAATVLGRPVEFAEIRDAIVMAAESQSLGRVRIGETPVEEMTPQVLLDDILFLLAGIAAEEVILGSRSAGGGGEPGSDLHLATLVALRFEASYGLGEGLAYLSANRETDLFRILHTSQAVRARVEAILTGQMTRARELIKRHRAKADLMTERLLGKKRLAAADVVALLAEAEPQPIRSVIC
jgi:ATP-dependent Zn protease